MIPILARMSSALDLRAYHRQALVAFLRRSVEKEAFLRLWLDRFVAERHHALERLICAECLLELLFPFRVEGNIERRRKLLRTPTCKLYQRAVELRELKVCKGRVADDRIVLKSEWSRALELESNK